MGYRVGLKDEGGMFLGCRGRVLGYRKWGEWGRGGYLGLGNENDCGFRCRYRRRMGGCRVGFGCRFRIFFWE